MHATDIREQIQLDPEVIPSLPDVVAAAMALLDRPDVGPDDFERLLCRDPPLVAVMLRIANSPAYGFAHRRETVRDAVVGMGLNGLRGVLLSSTLKHFMGRQFSSYGRDPSTLWRHSMAVAVGARFLTTTLAVTQDDPEEMFVAGLLHDLGKLLLAPFLSRAGVDVTADPAPAHVVEQRVLGMCHQEAGDLVAEKWHLGPLARAVIAHHHANECPQEFRLAVAIVRLADQCATEGAEGAAAPSGDPQLLQADLAALSLTPERWQELRMATIAAMERAAT